MIGSIGGWVMIDWLLVNYDAVLFYVIGIGALLVIWQGETW